MLYITIISVIAAAACLVRLWFVKREMKRMTSKLKAYNDGRTGKKLDLTFFDRHIESLAAEINRQSDLVVEAEAQRRRTENELRQAVANISHDIRTPLTSIFGYIQLLESDEITGEEKQEYVGIVKNRTKRLQVLLNDFFELSVIESPDYPMKHERLRLNILLPDIVTGLYDQFNEYHITPDLQLPESDIILYADESAVRRVAENLLLNTIKHTSGQVRIILQMRQGMAVLTIANEARHLTGSDLNVLFDRFYTADQTRSGKGTGLGLSIARSLMEKMNGSLNAELQGGHLLMICKWKLP
ncbi:HAMP domain-containing histidine kinase [Paenibacillus sepulcri]|uniref:histidine kinase n=2 Tax=Paenibacillus sepulcri TaxID=359917 RepID=A0ABS7C1Z6_9BACL|nr:HAMP domain-containing histidine kinase [Paenibacillus sepulcri]